MTISVCLATHKRPDRLALVLEDLQRQQLKPDQVVIVDNDAAGSARGVVEAARASAPYPIDYAIQPERNIAMTRNRTVELASADWLAFIDDDERASADWLQKLMQAAQIHQADGVLAPVEPQLPEDAPQWIRDGRFYDFSHQPEGAEVPLNRMRFGNVLLNGVKLRAETGPFDVRYGLTTGEDGDLLVRMVQHGSRIIWTETAPVWEPIEPKRLSLRWLMLRAFSGGQEFGRQTVTGRYFRIGAFGRIKFFIQVVAQTLVAAILALISWPAGRHRAAKWLITCYANLGKLSAFWGSKYSAYS